MPGDDLWSEQPDDDPLDEESELDEPWDGDEPDDESSDTVLCPECGAEVYEDALQCPACGNYLSAPSTSPWTGRPLWWILLGLLGTGALIYVLAMPG